MEERERERMKRDQEEAVAARGKSKRRGKGRKREKKALKQGWKASCLISRTACRRGRKCVCSRAEPVLEVLVDGSRGKSDFRPTLIPRQTGTIQLLLGGCVVSQCSVPGSHPVATEKRVKGWQAKKKVLADWIRMMDECPDEWDGVGPPVIGMPTPPGTQSIELSNHTTCFACVPLVPSNPVTEGLPSAP